MKRISVLGDWNYMNAGGCGKFGTYDKNPAYAFNMTDDAEIQVRLRVLEESSPDGQIVIREFEQFSVCTNIMVYRV
jgi:hypothetical protein